MGERPKTALVLTGGGARAAYQVGVLSAIREMLPNPEQNPFPILCGASAGAINAAVLACWAENFGSGVEQLRRTWAGFHAADVYRADALGVAANGARWISALMLGWLVRQNPKSLLDNAPLRTLLEQRLDFSRIDHAIASGALHSLSITCSGYASGHSVTFFQGHPELQTWSRMQRFGARAELTIDHLMASSAIPFVFPAVRIHREYFGDGSMRQLAPISPAVHLGAERILVIGAGRMGHENERAIQESYPSLAQIAGHTLSSIFLDSMYVDLERLSRINNTVRLIPEEVRRANGLALRPIKTLVIAPSERLDALAARHVRALPWPVRALLRGIGAMNRRGGALASYLLFEPEYTGALIALGYADTITRKSEVLQFLE
ncbi:MAG TPA: patatin-like phospholipase family protein [Rhodocyclaceae bacterium]|nr:patatin-like phospholipase family protein [Rhodocyclaceae bacterium]